MDINKITKIASKHELDIIYKDNNILINSYKDNEKYKLFVIEDNLDKKKFYRYFIDELLKNIKTKYFFNQLIEDTDGYSELFEDLSYLTKKYGNLFKEDKWFSATLNIL